MDTELERLPSRSRHTMTLYSGLADRDNDTQYLTFRRWHHTDVEDKPQPRCAALDSMQSVLTGHSSRI
jgi:hypothetical protein